MTRRETQPAWAYLLCSCHNPQRLLLRGLFAMPSFAEDPRLVCASCYNSRRACLLCVLLAMRQIRAIRAAVMRFGVRCLAFMLNRQTGSRSGQPDRRHTTRRRPKLCALYKPGANLPGFARSDGLRFTPYFPTQSTIQRLMRPVLRQYGGIVIRIRPSQIVQYYQRRCNQGGHLTKPLHEM